MSNLKHEYQPDISAARTPVKRRLRKQFKRTVVYRQKACGRLLRHLVSLPAGEALHSDNFADAAGIGEGTVLLLRNRLIADKLIEERTPLRPKPGDCWCRVTMKGKRFEGRLMKNSSKEKPLSKRARVYIAAAGQLRAKRVQQLVDQLRKWTNEWYVEDVHGDDVRKKGALVFEIAPPPDYSPRQESAR